VVAIHKKAIMSQYAIAPEGCAIMAESVSILVSCKEVQEQGLCTANCCGCVEIPKGVYEKNKQKAQRQVSELLELDGGVYPMTTEFKCIFLSRDYQCVIYEDRPEVCRLYQKTEELPCPFLRNGNLRSPAGMRRTERIINHHVDYALKRMRNR